MSLQTERTSLSDFWWKEEYDTRLITAIYSVNSILVWDNDCFYKIKRRNRLVNLTIATILFLFFFSFPVELQNLLHSKAISSSIAFCLMTMQLAGHLPRRWCHQHRSLSLIVCYHSFRSISERCYWLPRRMYAYELVAVPLGI